MPNGLDCDADESSGCSVGFGTRLDVYTGEPGTVRGLHLIVEDIVEARAELIGRRVEVGVLAGFSRFRGTMRLCDPVQALCQQDW